MWHIYVTSSNMCLELGMDPQFKTSVTNATIKIPIKAHNYAIKMSSMAYITSLIRGVFRNHARGGGQPLFFGVSSVVRRLFSDSVLYLM